MELRTERKVAVIGLGYVGLPLAVALGVKRPVVGFDINSDRVRQISDGSDTTREVTSQELRNAGQLHVTSDTGDLADCTFFIVTVPTPIDDAKRPDLAPLMAASKTVGDVLKPGDIVVFESTVYPGATEEDCVPILESQSGLVFNRDFFVGYSPERINPGDRTRRLPDIVKVVSGSDPAATDEIEAVYASIVTAGTYRAQSIRVAEAAKVIENTQRDLNIALMNELAIIFNRMGLDTEEVLKAAGTKWNFLPFKPGLVGGHCIGVDPYYLTHKAEQTGYHPQIILAGRRLNDTMGAHVAGQLVKTMLRQGISVDRARVLVLGLAFKENCPDLRNTRVVDVIGELQEYGIAADVHDPWVDADAAFDEYGITLLPDPEQGAYDGIIIAVAHDQFHDAGSAALHGLGAENHVLYDLKSIFPADETDLRL